MGARNTEQENMEPSIDMNIIATTVCILQEHRRKKCCILNILKWLMGRRKAVAYLTPCLISAYSTNSPSLRILLAPHSRAWPGGLVRCLSLRL